MVFCNSGRLPEGATRLPVTILILIDGFLQLNGLIMIRATLNSHNPYFNRWFSAIYYCPVDIDEFVKVTILILIDGFLQYEKRLFWEVFPELSQSLF